MPLTYEVLPIDFINQKAFLINMIVTRKGRLNYRSDMQEVICKKILPYVTLRSLY